MTRAALFRWMLAALLTSYPLAIVLALVLPGRQAAIRPQTGGNPLGNPPGMVDRLVLMHSADDWRGGTHQNTAAATSSPARLALLGLERKEYPQRGIWTSPEHRAEFPFTELLPSINADLPTKAGLRLLARVRIDGEWSPWLHFGNFGSTSPAERLAQFSGGQVHTDVLVLDRPADAFQLRVELFSFEAPLRQLPSLRRLAVWYSGVVDDAARRDELTRMDALPSGWARDLNVPFRAQGDAPECLRHEICSPTSVNMVMGYLGREQPLEETAQAIYDNDHGIFGNWARAVQHAAQMGFNGQLERFRSWEPVKRHIAAGRPVIASIRFEAGTFPSAAMAQTDGHLIVIRGFTPEGDVIVNDPGSKSKGRGAVYKANELAQAWFGRGGVGYVIWKSGG